MPVKRFDVPGHATRREFAVYVVVARKPNTTDFYLYIGKTGDNRDGCNPVISRAGNHFSYNDIHSQVRNKLPETPPMYEYEYLYITFDQYDDDENLRKIKVDVVNEMERAVNKGIQNIISSEYSARLLNPYGASGYIRKDEKEKRDRLRTQERMIKVNALVEEVASHIKSFAPNAIKK